MTLMSHRDLEPRSTAIRRQLPVLIRQVFSMPVGSSVMLVRHRIGRDCAANFQSLAAYLMRYPDGLEFRVYRPNLQGEASREN